MNARSTLTTGMRVDPFFVAAGAWALLAGGGCARTAEERQLDAMRAEIDRLQQDRDRDTPSEARVEPEETRPPAPAPAAASALAPGAQVVRLGEDEDEATFDYADPEDSAPRPRIRVLGSPRVRGRDVEEVDDSAGTTSPGHASALDPEAKRAYDAAMALVNGNECDRALDALASFLVKWPEHPYADHAMYWRGECYYARGDYAKAADQLEGVLARFPAGSKAPDALLMAGKAYEKLGQTRKAGEAFDRLRRDHPGSDAAAHLPAPAPVDSRSP